VTRAELQIFRYPIDFMAIPLA